MRVWLFNIGFYGYTFLIAFSAWVASYLGTLRGMQRILKAWSVGVLWMVRVLLRGRIEFRGLENIPREGPLLIVSKHQSELDVVCHLHIHPHLSAVAMKELERYPFLGRVTRALEMVIVAVDSGPQNRTAQTVEGTMRAFAKGRPMLIYPEGTLMSLGAKERYRRGAAQIYDALKVPAVPVAMSLGLIWPRREWRKRLGQHAVIEFMEPIAPGMAPNDFTKEVERRIETRTMELIEETGPADVIARARERFARGAKNED